MHAFGMVYIITQQRIIWPTSVEPTCALAMTSTSHMAAIVHMNAISSSVGIAAR